MGKEYDTSANTVKKVKKVKPKEPKKVAKQSKAYTSRAETKTQNSTLSNYLNNAIKSIETKKKQQKAKVEPKSRVTKQIAKRVDNESPNMNRVVKVEDILRQQKDRKT